MGNAGLKIEVRQLSEEEKKKMGIDSWPKWQCDVSEFDWQYDSTERCLFLKGDVIVATEEGDVRIKAGDFVVFPKGLKCRWRVLEAVEKHYSFS